jgi:enoyl-CoA hydratase
VILFQRAYDIGFVNRVTDGAALDAAFELAGKVAANGPLALIATKRIINERPDWTTEEMWSKQAAIAMPVLTSADAREGSMAFAEKRKPNWTGK